MKGVVFPGDRKIQYLDVPDPTPGPLDVVIEMKASGMCGTDLQNYRRPLDQPAYMPSLIGRLPIAGHAPYLKVPANTVVTLPDALSFEAGAAIACGTGTAYQALRRMNLSAADTIAIFGQGPVGLSATQFARHECTRDRHRYQRAAARSRTPAGRRRGLRPVRRRRCRAGHPGADRRAGRRQVPGDFGGGIRAAKTWGTCCFVGEGGEVRINVSPELLRRQMTVMGSWTFSTTGQAECAAFVAAKGIDVGQLYTHRWTLDRAEEVYRLFDQGVGGKGVFLL
jgi:threonine dehydrogenase-like Zn-dependent dehydrogenase